jgi:hypothetical protein
LARSAGSYELRWTDYRTTEAASFADEEEARDAFKRRLGKTVGVL